MKYICCECKKSFAEKNVLTTGFEDNAGKVEVVCKKCDKGRENRISDGI